jgi:hypothetical protein
MIVVEEPKGNLNNVGDLIILYDGNKNIIDIVSYGNWDDGNIFDNVLKANDPDSVARFIDGKNTSINYNDFRITTTPTKGLSNIINGNENDNKKESEDVIEEIIVDYPKLIITEILPNPDGSDIEGEFIEIFNLNEVGVDLSGWKLDDGEGGSREYEIKNIFIEANEYLSFSRETTGIALNNNSDNARLFNPNGELVDYIEYEEIKENISYSLFDNIWHKTTEITPGEENVIEEKQEVIKTGQVKSSGSGFMKLTGTVSVEPGVLGAQIFYIADEDIQVYSYKKDFPELSVGDVVEVSGELSESGGERRIKTKTQNNIKIIGKQDVLLPEDILISDIGEALEGRFVKITGEILEVRGSYVFVDDGSDEARVYIKSTTNIDKKIFNEADQIEIVGIVSQTKSGYRLLPRYDTDILIVGSIKGEQEEMEENSIKNNNERYLFAIIVFLTVVISFLLYRQRSTIKIDTN